MDTRECTLLLGWLEHEAETSGSGFYSRKLEIQRAQDNGALWGLFEKGHPVAFLANGLRKDGFLEVRPDRRGQGYGRKLVQHRIDAVIANDSCCLLDIECVPPDSIPFWQRLGFELYNGSFAFKRVPRRFSLPGVAEVVQVRVRSFPDFVLQTGELVEPLDDFRPDAVVLPDGDIQLAERIVFFAGQLNRRYDLIVKLEADGKERVFARLTSDAAYAAGVRDDAHGNHYLDRISVPPLSDVPSRR